MEAVRIMAEITASIFLAFGGLFAAMLGVAWVHDGLVEYRDLKKAVQRDRQTAHVRAETEAAARKQQIRELRTRIYKLEQKAKSL